MIKFTLRAIYTIIICLFVLTSSAQRYLTDIDSVFFIKDTVRPFIKRFENLVFSGYLQPQFQIAAKKGINSFNGGNFDPNVSNRFIIRRARFKTEYNSPDKNGFNIAKFTFQLDATEKKISINEANVTVFESKWKLFSVSAGMMERPFGYELKLSSSRQEADERGRMSQTLMNGEVDLGATLSLENKKGKGLMKYLKIESGFFNGQGLTGTKDFDSYKDLISRANIKPITVSKNIILSGGISILGGGLAGGSKYVYKFKNTGSLKYFDIDSSIANIGKKTPRKYYGADVQVIIKHKTGTTELRAEYWKGTQTATISSSATPSELLKEPLFIRSFNGAFFYFLQNIVNKKHQIGIKYDWYDPNTKVKKSEIGKAGSNFTAADIRYGTIGVGYNYYINDNVKLLLWYSFVKNESTSLNTYISDLKDNVFTCRLQFRF